MSQENVEVVRRQFQACRDGALDEAARYWHPDIEWRAIEGAADDVGIIRGEGGLRRYYQDWIDTMDALRRVHGPGRSDSQRARVRDQSASARSRGVAGVAPST
jgi:ketosteroid isomerase-like protein